MKASGKLSEFLADGLHRRWRKYRKAFRQCGKKFCPDSVHEFRVETRRMLAFLNLLEPLVRPESLPGIQRHICKPFKTSARLRDTHVQLCYLQEQVKMYPEIKPFLKILERREQRFTRKLKKRLSRGLKSGLKKDMRRLRCVLGALLAEACVEDEHAAAVMRAVDAAFARVLELKQAVDVHVPATIHCLRIAFKKFRYMVEALAPVLPREFRCRTEEMHAYQTAMGEVQDVEVLLGTMKELGEKQHLLYPRFHAFLIQRHGELIDRFMKGIERVMVFWPAAKTPIRLRLKS